MADPNTRIDAALIESLRANARTLGTTIAGFDGNWFADQIESLRDALMAVRGINQSIFTAAHNIAAETVRATDDQ